MQTALDIHFAAMKLCKDVGLDAVTTETISLRAGISLRTFFNYFPNKEAAIVHRPSVFPDHAVAAFVEGKGTLLEDMRDLLGAHLSRLDDNRDRVLLIQSLLRENPGLTNAHEAAMRQLTSELAAILAKRMGTETDPLVNILAGVVICGTKMALDAWITQDQKPIADSIDEILADLKRLGTVLR